MLIRHDDLKLDEKEKFADVINTIINRKFVLERKFNVFKGKMERNSQYSFLEVHKELVEEYLKIIGWQLIERKTRGIFFVEKQVSKIELLSMSRNQTIFLLLIRILYDKKHSEVSLEQDMYFKLEELLEEVNNFSLSETLINRTELQKSLVFLRKHNIIEKVHGDYHDPKSEYLIYPSIEPIIDSEVVEGILEEFSEYERNKELNQYLEEDEEDIEEVEEISDEDNY